MSNSTFSWRRISRARTVLAASATRWPARSRCRIWRRPMPGSSSKTRMVPAAPGLLIGSVFAVARPLDDLQEKAEPPDGVDEAVVFHRLGDIDVAAQFVA